MCSASPLGRGELRRAPRGDPCGDAAPRVSAGQHSEDPPKDSAVITPRRDADSAQAQLVRRRSPSPIRRRDGDRELSERRSDPAERRQRDSPELLRSTSQSNELRAEVIPHPGDRWRAQVPVKDVARDGKIFEILGPCWRNEEEAKQDLIALKEANCRGGMVDTQKMQNWLFKRGNLPRSRGFSEAADEPTRDNGRDAPARDAMLRDAPARDAGPRDAGPRETASREQRTPTAGDGDAAAGANRPSSAPAPMLEEERSRGRSVENPYLKADDFVDLDEDVCDLTGDSLGGNAGGGGGNRGSGRSPGRNRSLSQAASFGRAPSPADPPAADDQRSESPGGAVSRGHATQRPHSHRLAVNLCSPPREDDREQRGADRQRERGADRGAERPRELAVQESGAARARARTRTRSPPPRLDRDRGGAGMGTSGSGSGSGGLRPRSPEPLQRRPMPLSGGKGGKGGGRGLVSRARAAGQERAALVGSRP